jgi:hypothetical protein
MTTTVIWIGDLLLSMNALAPADDRTVEAIAHLLGFERTAVPSEQSAPSEKETLPTLPADAALVASSSSQLGLLPPIAPSAELQETIPASVASSSFPVERLPPIAPRTALSARSDPVTPLQLTAAVPYLPPMPVPLLSPLAGRYIVQELVTSSRFGPDPDIDCLIDALARREIPQPVPLQECRTLVRGAQVLVDDGEGMEPFADDQQAVVDLVRRLAGDASVDVRAFHEVPDPADPVDPWDPPPPRTPVLALTDLGLAGRNESGALGLATAWQSAAATLAMRGSSLIALIPYPAARWPAQLRACMRLVCWDRSTTAANARQARRAGPAK